MKSFKQYITEKLEPEHIKTVQGWVDNNKQSMQVGVPAARRVSDHVFGNAGVINAGTLPLSEGGHKIVAIMSRKPEHIAERGTGKKWADTCVSMNSPEKASRRPEELKTDIRTGTHVTYFMREQDVPSNLNDIDFNHAIARVTSYPYKGDSGHRVLIPSHKIYTATENSPVFNKQAQGFVESWHERNFPMKDKRYEAEPEYIDENNRTEYNKSFFPPATQQAFINKVKAGKHNTKEDFATAVDMAQAGSIETKIALVDNLHQFPHHLRRSLEGQLLSTIDKKSEPGTIGIKETDHSVRNHFARKLISGEIQYGDVHPGNLYKLFHHGTNANRKAVIDATLAATSESHKYAGVKRTPQQIANGISTAILFKSILKDTNTQAARNAFSEMEKRGFNQQFEAMTSRFKKP